MSNNLPDTTDRKAPTLRETFNEEEIQILKESVVPGATNAQLRLFAKVCQSKGLDPFGGQIHGVIRDGKLTIQTGIDGFRARAQETGKWEGTGKPQWCGGDGEWTDVWLSDKPPTAAKVPVYHSDFREPKVVVAKWSEFNQGTFAWKRYPSHMLAKCAESQALRAAFPEKLGGMYSDAEIEGAEGGLDAEARVIEDDSDYDSRTDELRAELEEDTESESEPETDEDVAANGQPPANTEDAADGESEGESESVDTDLPEDFPFRDLLLDHNPEVRVSDIVESTPSQLERIEGIGPDRSMRVHNAADLLHNEKNEAEPELEL